MRTSDNKAIHTLTFHNSSLISVESSSRRYPSNSIIEVEKLVDIVWICCVDSLSVGPTAYLCLNNIMAFDEGYRLSFF